MRRDDSGEFWLRALGGAFWGALEQLASDLVASAINGEWTFSHWSSYVGAAVGGAVGALIPGAKALGDVVGTITTTATTAIAYNIESSIVGREDNYCFEEVFYTIV